MSATLQSFTHVMLGTRLLGTRTLRAPLKPALTRVCTTGLHCRNADYQQVSVTLFFNVTCQNAILSCRFKECIIYHLNNKSNSHLPFIIEQASRMFIYKDSFLLLFTFQQQQQQLLLLLLLPRPPPPPPPALLLLQLQLLQQHRNHHQQQHSQ